MLKHEFFPVGAAVADAVDVATASDLQELLRDQRSPLPQIYRTLKVVNPKGFGFRVATNYPLPSVTWDRPLARKVLGTAWLPAGILEALLLQLISIPGLRSRGLYSPCR